MNYARYLGPNEAKEVYLPVALMYQRTFSEEPWYEVSKCPDTQQRCPGGLSALAVGQLCLVCNSKPERPAYEQVELVARFSDLDRTGETCWYIEGDENGLTLCAIARLADARRIAVEKYGDVPAMKDWLNEIFGTKNFIWLDEVFANRQKKPTGNLSNFTDFCRTFGEIMECDTIAFRTISPQMKRAAMRFSAASIWQKCSTQDLGFMSVPDRRDFVVIDLKRSQQ